MSLDAQKKNAFRRKFLLRFHFLQHRKVTIMAQKTKKPAAKTAGKKPSVAKKAPAKKAAPKAAAAKKVAKKK
jgi:hypothetical protein